MTVPATRMLQAGEVRVSAFHCTSGSRTLLFLPGLGCTKQSFLGAFLAPELAGFSLCAFDLPGHGDTITPEGHEFSVRTCAQVLDHVLAEIGEDVILVGHSLGGAVALLCAGRFRRLVSIEGNLVGPDCGIVSRRIAEQPLDTFLDTGFAALLAGLDLLDWKRWFATCDPTAIHQIACSLVEVSESGRLLRHYLELSDRIYLYGDTDSRPRHLLPALAGTPTRGIPGSGHFPMLDNPSHFYALLAETAQED